MTSVDLKKLAIRLQVNRPYDPKMIYSWSIGLIGNKNKVAVELLSNQFDQALIDAHKRGEFIHYNFFLLSQELRDRAEDPQWRMTWES